MAELVDMLHKEEAGLTVDRSLDGAPKDVQSFEIFLTGDWRSNFDTIYQVVVVVVVIVVVAAVIVVAAAAVVVAVVVVAIVVVVGGGATIEVADYNNDIDCIIHFYLYTCMFAYMNVC